MVLKRRLAAKRTNSGLSIVDNHWLLVDEVPTPPGRVISNDVSEPNRLREIIPAVSVEPFRVDREYLVEMKEVDL